MLRIVLRIARVRQIAPLCTAARITRATTSGHQSSIYFTVHSNHKIGHSNCRKQYIHVSSVLGNEFVVLKTPSFAESISEGDVRWDKGVGDAVDVDEVVAEIETDKTSIPVPSSVSGVIEELLVADGDTVTAGMDLCKIRITDKVDAPPVSTKDPPSSSVDTTPAEPIRKEVKQDEPPSAVSGPAPTSIPPIPPIPTQPMSHGPPTPAPVTSIPSATAAVSTRGEQKVKMNRMRQRIAERLKDAQNTNAMLTTFNEIDMSRVIDMRNRHKEAFLKKHGVKLGFMSPFVKAASYALQDQPVVNAVIDGNEIIYRDYIDISCAVATPKGLVVPILRDVQNMSFADVEKELNILAAKAREGTLAIEEMEGGTFTISNGGVYGSMFGTPIINPPQSAILGMHATKDRPVAIDGKVEIRPMMYVALTYDHRLIDGREAVTFLKKIKSAVEDPAVLLTDI